MTDIPLKSQGALNQVPQTFNQQPGTSFKVNIKRFPDVNYYVYKINIPTITLPMAPEATPILAIPKPGSQVMFDPLVMVFRVEEGLKNFTQLGDWMKTIASLYEPGPSDLNPLPSPYGLLAENAEWTGEGVTTEILVAITGSAKNSILNMTFHDCWPSQLSMNKTLDSTTADVQYLDATATFRYSYYEFSTP